MLYYLVQSSDKDQTQIGSKKKLLIILLVHYMNL